MGVYRYMGTLMLLLALLASAITGEHRADAKRDALRIKSRPQAFTMRHAIRDRWLPRNLYGEYG